MNMNKNINDFRKTILVVGGIVYFGFIFLWQWQNWEPWLLLVVLNAVVAIVAYLLGKADGVIYGK